MKRITIIPETLAEMPKKEEEIRIPISTRLKKSIYEKLKQSSMDTGYSQTVILERALEAFLK